MAIVVDNVGLEIRREALLHGVSTRFEADTPAVILGASGAGKTSLIRCVLGLERRFTGTIAIDGAEGATLSARQRARWLAWLPQRESTLEPLQVPDYLLGSRYAFDESRQHSLEIIQQTLDHCGLTGLVGRRVDTLSGGEFQRVQVAGLLAQGARFLILDEPANHLDPGLRHWLCQVLADQVGAGVGVVAVTHDLGLIADLTERSGRPVQILGLKRGRLDFDLTSDEPDLTCRLAELYDIEFVEVAVHGRREFIAR